MFAFTDIVLPAALVIDLAIGDPRWLPHPIRWMGAAIGYLEPVFRKLIPNRLFSGALFASALVMLVWLLTWTIVWAAHGVNAVLGILVETVLIFYCISIGSLRDAARQVKITVEQGTLEQARAAVAWIVGRDTRFLDHAGVNRAAVETVAENLVDGTISPVFYAAIGGAPLAMAFKMVSTLDSMIGYKNDTYLEFGKAAAKMDDLANYIPARLAVPIIALAAQILFGSGKKAVLLVRQDGRSHASPNAGLPEAAFAGALGVKLGGPNTYHGNLIEKPYIGAHLNQVHSRHIARACKLMVLSSILWVAVIWMAMLFINTLHGFAII